MQVQFRSGFIPYEIGDKIELKGNTTTLTIKDIKMIQYLASGRVEFEVLIKETNAWISSTLIDRRIE